MRRLLVICFALSLAGCSADSAPPPAPAKTPTVGPAVKKGEKMKME